MKLVKLDYGAEVRPLTKYDRSRGWLWNRSKKRFIYCTPPYVWQNKDWPIQYPELGETQIERVAILVGERVELVEQSSTIRTGTKAKNGGRR